MSEIFATLMRVRDSITVETDGEDVIACPDSEVMIGALMSPVMTYRLVKELKAGTYFIHPTLGVRECPKFSSLRLQVGTCCSAQVLSWNREVFEIYVMNEL